MKPLERLHIDELKRVEKQAATLLKSRQRLQQDFGNLNARFKRLSEQHEAAQISQAAALAEREEQNREALSALEGRWQNKYDQEIATLQADHAERIDKLQEEIAILKDTQLQELEASRKERQHAVEALQAELTHEKKINAAMVARIRGVTHE